MGNKWVASKAWGAVDSHESHSQSCTRSRSFFNLLSKEDAEMIVGKEELFLSLEEEVSGIS